jgi:hypothetical protein
VSGEWNDQDPATLNPIVTDIDSQTELWTVNFPVPAGPISYRLQIQR